MTRVQKWHPAPLAAAVWMLGCASDPYTALQAEDQALADAVCTRCPQGFSSSATTELQCRAMLESTLTEAEETCVRRAYDDNSADVEPFFNCTLPLFRDFRACMTAAVETCPPNEDDRTACFERLVAASERCPRPSAATQAEIGACTP